MRANAKSKISLAMFIWDMVVGPLAYYTLHPPLESLGCYAALFPVFLQPHPPEREKKLPRSKV
jgi:hypothetical protein